MSVLDDLITEKRIGPLICNSYFAKTNPSSFYFVQPAILDGLDELWDRSAGNLAATGSLADASATVMASAARGTSGAGKRGRETAGQADDEDEEAEEEGEVDPATQRTAKKANHNKPTTARGAAPVARQPACSPPFCIAT